MLISKNRGHSMRDFPTIDLLRLCELIMLDEKITKGLLRRSGLGLPDMAIEIENALGLAMWSL